MSPISAALLNLCCPLGLGQFMLGQHAKGALIFVVGFMLTALSSGIGWLPIATLAAMDAYAIASKLRQGRSVGQWEFF